MLRNVLYSKINVRKQSRHEYLVKKIFKKRIEMFLKLFLLNIFFFKFS